MKSLVRPDALICELLVVAFAVVLLIGKDYPSDAALFPTLVGASGVLLGLGYLASNCFRRSALRIRPDDDGLGTTDRRLFAIALSSSPLYSICVYILGFHVSTFLAMVAMPILLGFRRRLWLLPIGAVTVFALHMVFAVAMEIDLPMGLIGDFLMRRFVYQD